MEFYNAANTELPAEVASWSQREAKQWFQQGGAFESFMSAFSAFDADGEVLCSVADEGRNSPQILAGLLRSKSMQELQTRCLEAPVGRAYRSFNWRHAERFFVGLRVFPRLTLLQLQLTDVNETLELLESRPVVLPSKQWVPRFGEFPFTLLSILCPQILVIVHAIPFFGSSHWTMNLLVVDSVQSLLNEWWFAAERLMRRRRIVWWRRLFMDALPENLARFLCFAVYWYGLVPWYVYWTVFWMCYHAMVTPILHVLRQEYVRATVLVVFSSLPLMFDENWRRDSIIYFAVTGVGLGCLICFRLQISRMTPREIETALGPFSPMIGSIKHVVTIPEADFLRASIVALNRLDPKTMRSALPISIRYEDELLQLQQEGIDAGGLYRDWLCRLAQGLLRDEVGLFATYTVNGEEFLKLRHAGSASQVVHARCAGRLLALSLKANVSLGWALCEPLARLLLFADLPDLLDGRFSLCRSRSRSGEQLNRWLGSLGFNSKIWIWAAVGEGEAQWYLNCIDTTRTLQERQLLFDAAGIVDSNVTLNTLVDHMRERVKMELIQSVAKPLKAFWEGFQSIPDALLPASGDLKPRLVCLAQPRHWDVLAGHALGRTEIDVEDWRRHTHVIGQARCQVAKWFWRYARSLDASQRQQLLFWWTSHRRPPHRGFQALPDLRLNICAPSDRLPVAHTCFYCIDLPAYSRFEVLQEKLGVAMWSTSFHVE